MNRRYGLVVLVFAVATACAKDAETPRTANAATPTPATEVINESAGDVVIPMPAAAYSVRPVSAPGTVSGAVTLSDPLDPLPPAPTGRDSASCGQTISDDALRQANGGLGGVVVWLDGIRAGKAPNAERRVELESHSCKLSPRMQAAMVGSAVNVLGHDDFRQHLRFFAGGEATPRAVVLLAGGEQVIPTELPFKAPGMVTVRDADHPWTRAYLAVFDHPYYAVTEANGSFTIDGVPAGKYTLHAWHERTGPATQEVDVTANGAVKVSVPLTAK